MPIGPLAVFGGGTMGRAIVARCVDRGVIEAACTFVAETGLAKHAEFHDFGVRPFATATEAAAAAESLGRAVWLLAVKPQSFKGLATELRAGGFSPDGRIIISIMAGLTAQTVAEELGCASRGGVVRTMPNLGATTGQGVAAIADNTGAGEPALRAAERLMGCLGPCVERIDESLLNAFTAVAGSGPAYVFFLAEAMIASATDLGLPPSMADRVVRATISGAAALLADSESSPASLRSSVTSKGGTTQAAIEAMERDSVGSAIRRAIAAAAARAAELASDRK